MSEKYTAELGARAVVAEPCRTGGLVPGMREIKGALLGRLLYYLV